MDAELTIPEACHLLDPPMRPGQLRAIIHVLGIKPSGSRKTGTAGHPRHTYPADTLLAIHTALAPWLTDCVSSNRYGSGVQKQGQ